MVTSRRMITIGTIWQQKHLCHLYLKINTKRDRFFSLKKLDYEQPEKI